MNFGIISLILRKKLPYLLAGLAAIVLGCDRLLDFGGRVGHGAEIQLIQDSATVRHLIGQQEVDGQQEQQGLQAVINERQTEFRAFEQANFMAVDLDVHPDRYIPRRLASIAAMNQRPTILVAARRADIDFLQHVFNARCGQKATQESYYARIRIHDDGAAKGAAGWVCVSEAMFLADPSEKEKRAATVTMRIILDSPEVRGLIASQEMSEVAEWQNVQRIVREANSARRRQGPLDEELALHPERYIPKRLAFAEAMKRQPTVQAVAQNSYCRFLQRSRASCLNQPIPAGDHHYVRIRITSGPSKGQEGWACMFENVWLNGPLLP